MANFDNIINLYPNFKGYTGNPPKNEKEYNKLDCWIDPSQKPTWESLSSLMKIDDVRNKRKEEYPPIGDQLDALWKGGDDADAMKVLVNKVKTDNPKE